MNRTTIKAGQPKSRPLIQPIALFPSQIKIEFRLDDNSDYQAVDNDWYKLGGISFSLKPNKDAALVGIRQVAGKWELIPYINRNGDKYHGFQPFALRKYQYYAVIITPQRSEGYLVYELTDGVDVLCQWVTLFDKWSAIGYPRKFYAGGDSFPLNDFSLEWQITVK